MTLPRTTRQLLKITYPTGAVAYAPVFPDGTYYGKDDVDAGRAVAETVTGGYPLDRYYEWASHTPAAVLEEIEQTFAQLLRIVGPARTRQILEEISTPEVYTHFRRWEEDEG